MTLNTQLDRVAGLLAKLTRKQKVAAGSGLAIAVVGSALFLALSSSGADAGDCVGQNGPNSLQPVDCDSPEARYKVVGRVDGKSQAEATFSTCGVFKETTDIYWEESFVLCMTTVSR